MSLRREKLLALTGINYEGKPTEELADLFKKVLASGMHGIGFCPYIECQKPGDQLSEAQI